MKAVRVHAHCKLEYNVGSKTCSNPVQGSSANWSDCFLCLCLMIGLRLLSIHTYIHVHEYALLMCTCTCTTMHPSLTHLPSFFTCYMYTCTCTYVHVDYCMHSRNEHRACIHVTNVHCTCTCTHIFLSPLSI